MIWRLGSIDLEKECIRSSINGDTNVICLSRKPWDGGGHDSQYNSKLELHGIGTQILSGEEV